MRSFFATTILYRKSIGEKFKATWLERLLLKLRYRDLVDIRSFFDSNFMFTKSVLELPEGYLPWDAALACLKVVSTSIKFVNDSVEHWQMPLETVDKETGDCEDGAILLANMLSALGLETVKIVCGAISTGIGHCVVEYNGVQLDWLHLAPIVKVWFKFSKDEVEICKT